MKRFSLTLIAAVILTCVLFCVLSPSAAHAQTQRAGYKVEYLDSWPLGSQFKYIRVRITPVTGVAADDLDFYTVVKVSGYQNGVTISTMIPIRKGDTFATGELYVPNNVGYNFSIHTEFDGDLRNDRTDFAKTNYFDNSFNSLNTPSSGVSPSFVLASSEIISDDSLHFMVMNRSVSPNLPSRTTIDVTESFPELSDLDLWYSNPNAAGFGASRPVASFNGLTSQLATAMSLESLPSKWFGYEGLGMLMISYSDLQLLARKHPGKLIAIERWVAGSGRLVVLNCGDKLQHSDEVLKLLGDQQAEIRDNRICKLQISEPDEKDLKKVRNVIESAAAAAGGYYPGSVYQTQSTQGIDRIKYPFMEDTLKNALSSGNAKDYLAVQFELGQIVCVSDRGSDWKTEKGNDVDRWSHLGLFLDKSDRKKFRNEYRVLNDLPIRGLGFPEFDEPPRYVFEFSILVYLLAIGPVTFFVLKRKHKLNLMFVFVPIVSALFCTTILAYAIFAEGFDTRVNVFTETWLNLRTGRQSTSSAAHVYSGITPSAYVLNSPTFGMVNLPSGGRTQRIAWSDADEEISNGEIRARTNHQLFTRCSNETDQRLSFSFASDDDEASAFVQNGFDTDIVGVAFRSRDCNINEVWFARQVTSGQRVKATKMSVTDVTDELRGMTRDRGQSILFNLNQGSRYNNRSGRWRGYVGDIESSEVATSLRNNWNLTEGILQNAVGQEDGLGFYAVTEQSINYDLPISNAKVEAAIHVLKGIR